jgi:hypothetical protein
VQKKWKEFKSLGIGRNSFGVVRSLFLFTFNTYLTLWLPELPSIRQRIVLGSTLKEMLLVAENRFNSDDAMAALHIISLYLFDGRQGRWDEFLDFACSYTVRVLDDPCYARSYPNALQGTIQKDEFVYR